MTTIPTDEGLRPNRGFHPLLERDNPYLVVDGCMQAWPDADYASAHRHGITVYGVTAFRPHASLEQALEDLMFFHLVARKYPSTLVVETVDDIHRARAEGKAAFLLSAQDGDWIGRSLHRIEAFYRLGLRVLIPAYNAANAICSGCLDYEDLGLTRFGALVVDECNRLGMLLDGSHVGKRSTLEMMDRSSQPFVFSHSNVKAIVDVERSIDDEQVKACAATDGVIGISNYGPFNWKGPGHDWPTIDDMVEHIDYLSQLLGTSRHTGFGSDMSLGSYGAHPADPWGTPDYPGPSDLYRKTIGRGSLSPRVSLRDFNAYPEVLDLADRLLSRGYTDEDVHGILGQNFLRVYAQVWK